MIDIGPGLTIPLSVLLFGLIKLGRGPVGVAFAERLRAGWWSPIPLRSARWTS